MKENSTHSSGVFIFRRHVKSVSITSSINRKRARERDASNHWANISHVSESWNNVCRECWIWAAKIWVLLVNFAYGRWERSGRLSSVQRSSSSIGIFEDLHRIVWCRLDYFDFSITCQRLQAGEAHSIYQKLFGSFKSFEKTFKSSENPHWEKFQSELTVMFKLLGQQEVHRDTTFRSTATAWKDLEAWEIAALPNCSLQLPHSQLLASLSTALHW